GRREARERLGRIRARTRVRIAPFAHDADAARLFADSFLRTRRGRSGLCSAAQLGCTTLRFTLDLQTHGALLDLRKQFLRAPLEVRGRGAQAPLERLLPLALAARGLAFERFILLRDGRAFLFECAAQSLGLFGLALDAAQ